MMSYEAFKTALSEKLISKNEWNMAKRKVEFYLDGFTSSDQAKLYFIRDTNIKYHKKEADILIGDFLTISNIEKEDIFCRFELKNLYHLYQSQNWERVWQEICENLKWCEKMHTNMLEHIDNYECIKDKLILRPVNFNDNRFELKNTIYKKVGDIALVVYLIMADNVVDLKHEVLSSKLYKEIYECWNLSEEIIWQEALLNTNVISPARFYQGPNDLTNPPYTRGAFMSVGNNLKLDNQKRYAPILTTTTQINGAIAFFYSGVMERIAQLMDGSYYVVFGSINEAYIHSAKVFTPKELFQNLKTINRSFNHPSQILTRKVFYYNAVTKKFAALEL